MPRVVALRDQVAARARIESLFGLSAPPAFNEMGIFRHYPELDE